MRITRAVAELREFFLLEGAQRRNSKVTETRRKLVEACYVAARRRLSVADALRIPTDAPAALSLYREGVGLLATAYLIATDEQDDIPAHGDGAWIEALDRALEKDGRRPPRAFALVKPVLTARDPVAIDRLAAEQDGDDSRLGAAAETARWLSRLVDPRSPRQLRLTRRARIAMAALGAVVALVAFGFWIWSPENLALNRVARSSSAALDTAPAGAVDGEKNGRYGFHSEEEDGPWLSIDLGRPCKVQEIRIFGRGDCCYGQSLPLSLELSSDGADFRQVAVRLEEFSESNPWVVSFSPTVTEFVRLRVERHSVLVLGEVEVYGWRAR